MGPNDASGVVWALGRFFLNIFPVFSKVTEIFMLSSFYLCITSTMRVWRGNEEKNGPKRSQMHHLGPRYVIFLLSADSPPTASRVVAAFAGTTRDMSPSATSWVGVFLSCSSHLLIISFYRLQTT